MAGFVICGARWHENPLGIEAGLISGRFKGVGEIHVNARSSAPSPQDRAQLQRCRGPIRPRRYPRAHGKVDQDKRVIFDETGFRLAEWLELIEAFPNRFVVGVDDTDSEEDYRRTVRAIRQGLLASLSAATARKVAYENADRLFGPR